jgi:hypothetical protein
MLVKMSLEDREYILKSERPGYWEKAVARVTSELEELQTSPTPVDPTKLEAKKKELIALTKNADTTKKKLEQYGPTKWTLASVDKETLIKNTASTNLNLGHLDTVDNSIRDVASGQVHFTHLSAISACKTGLKGWKNLRDAKGKEIPFNRELIGRLPLEILLELSNDILGVIDEDDEGNLEEPLES